MSPSSLCAKCGLNTQILIQCSSYTDCSFSSKEWLLSAGVGSSDWLQAYQLNADFVKFQTMNPSIVTLGMKSSFIAHE